MYASMHVYMNVYNMYEYIYVLIDVCKYVTIFMYECMCM